MALRTELCAAVAEARGRGWATCDVSLDDVLADATTSGIPVTPTRRGEQPIAALRPREAREAHPRSLSAVYGLGAFPLHTDGAHLRKPPDLVLLQTPEPHSGSETLLLGFRPSSLSKRLHEALRHGVFLVGTGHRGFYSTVLGMDGELRFDPVCMKPLDPGAHYARDWLAEALGSAVAHRFDACSTLVIDNRRCLHGRADVAHSPNRVVRRLMLHWGRQ